MPIKFEIQWRNRLSSKVNGWRPELKKALQLAGHYWHKNYLPAHFEKRAYRRYPGKYKQRREKLNRAARRAGRKRGLLRDPMVTTGTMKRNALRQARITGSARVLKVRLAGTRVANFHTGSNPTTGGYDFRTELTAVTQTEIKKMEQIVAQFMTAFLNKQHAPIRERK